MIIYSETKEQFHQDVYTNQIDEMILKIMNNRLHIKVSPSEQRSWRESIQYANTLLLTTNLPNDCGIAIEYAIPASSKRIDFMITGYGALKNPCVIILELKQWEDAQKTEKDAIVITFIGRGYREHVHPSYQVWSYKQLIEDYNQSVSENSIELIPCCYLHNFAKKGVLDDPFYSEYVSVAPVFIKNDTQLLRSFIDSHIKKGDNARTLSLLENGEIKPSKALADSLNLLLAGNKEFTLIDEQKEVFETALYMAKQSNQDGKKRVLIVKGGPGTGKSVVAINLLVALINNDMATFYVTKNAAPRSVYQAKLTGKINSRFNQLFKSSDSFYSSPADSIAALVVDEAHRLREKSGFYNNQGENQIKELITAAKFTVFFADDDQIVTLSDIGKVNEIESIAKSAGAIVEMMTLVSQFRCNGSDGYLNWIDNLLQIRQTANLSFAEIDYDFQVFDNPYNMHETIRQRNREYPAARVVAGYCWDWKSKSTPSVYDIEIGNYKARWNLNIHGQAWLTFEESIDEIGCIHTCQGLDLSYVGVIIGPDLKAISNEIYCYPENRSKHDKSIKGWKKMLKQNPISTQQELDIIIKNTYKTLMTRGMKGCYVYAVDRETREYFKSALIR
jgi:DUF2075 family protein